MPLWWMSSQYSAYFGEPSGPNMPDCMISEKPMMALSGVRSSWLILARNSDLVSVRLLGAILLLGVFLGELDHLLRLQLELLARLAEVGDGRHQAALAVDQLALVALQLGDVGADRDEAAVLGAPLVDLQPAAVLELQLEAARAFLGPAVGDHLGADERLPAGRDHLGIGRAGLRAPHPAWPWSCWYFELHITRRLSASQSTKASEIVSMASRRRMSAVFERSTSRICSVTSTAMPIRCGSPRLAVDQLGAGAQPDPASVGMAHAEHAVDGRFAGLVEGLGERHQVAVVGMDQPAAPRRSRAARRAARRPTISNIERDQNMRPRARSQSHRPQRPRISAVSKRACVSV